MKKLLSLNWKKILQNKRLLIAIGLVMGIVLGMAVFGGEYRANILEEPTSAPVTEAEVTTFFVEHPVIKDISVSPLQENKYLVEFMGTKGLGDSLHPYSYILTKEDGQFVNVIEVELEGDTSAPKL